MNRKQDRVASFIERHVGKELDPHYLGFFDCFNEGRFYEAHEVLETLWLGERQGPNASFYKGLIQLAGAFVHLQKSRAQPAASLLRLARTNLERYPEVHQRLDVGLVLRSIDECLRQLMANPEAAIKSLRIRL